MAFKLFLMRHGKSDWRVNSDDFHRPLKTRGETAAARLGLWLKQNKQLPDYILSSPATRAYETCKISCQAMGIELELIQQEPKAYHAGHSTIISLLKSLSPKYKNVMYVGHNPGMEDALLSLMREPPPPHHDGKTFPTGTLAHLEFAEPWGKIKSHSARLKQLVRGKEL